MLCTKGSTLLIATLQIVHDVCNLRKSKDVVTQQD